MKKNFLLLGVLFSLLSYGQTNNLKFILVNHEEKEGNSSLLDAFHDFIKDIRQNVPTFNYSSISYQSIDFMNSPNLVEESTVGSMKAANFIYCNKHLANQLIPIFIVKKNNQEIPYYASYIIVNKNSNILSLNSPEIKKLYYVDEQSASGYIVPIHNLWELGVISQPSLKSAKEKFGENNVIKAGTHQEVIQKVSEDKAFNSIGLCGEIPDSTSNSIILLRYSLLPEDVIFVSQNLKQYIPAIKGWFGEQLTRGIFKNTATHITGIEDFNLEYQAAYSNLEEIIKRVEVSENRSENRKFKYADIDTPSQLFSFLNELTFPEIWSIVGLLGAFFSAGMTVGRKYPQIIEVVKSTRRQIIKIIKPTGNGS